MTVPTFFNLDNGLGAAEVKNFPYVVLSNRIGPRYIFEDAVSGGGGGGTPPTSGQLWPRSA